MNDYTTQSIFNQEQLKKNKPQKYGCVSFVVVVIIETTAITTAKNCRKL